MFSSTLPNRSNHIFYTGTTAELQTHRYYPIEFNITRGNEITGACAYTKNKLTHAWLYGYTKSAGSVRRAYNQEAQAAVSCRRVDSEKQTKRICMQGGFVHLVQAT